MSTETIAVLIPCFNEEQTIGLVVESFKQALPQATIYVYDNNSTDGTVKEAKSHGAVVQSEPRQGKGNVVRQMFRDIESDFYVLVDGDSTYPASQVHDLLNPLVRGEADMVVGDRLSNKSYNNENKRAFHTFGNKLICFLIKHLYGVNVNDVLSGYRAFSRVYVKTCPILSKGFEVETELTIHTLDKNWRFIEVPVAYKDRPLGSNSKLSTFKDGLKLPLTILSLFKDYKPLALFTLIGVLLVFVGLILGTSVTIEFIATGLVERLPTALLAVGFVISGLLSLCCGLILDTIAKGQRKAYELRVNQVHMQAVFKNRP